MKKQETIILEPSTHTHKMVGKIKIVKILNELGGLVIESAGKSIVLHGEHGVICTEKKNIIKLTQQELNPITKKLQNAFD